LVSAPWWDDAVVYQIYPRSFHDSDGDGVGDLAGVRARLDHVAGLGVDALWLSPFQPSPMADFGYDVSDFTAVDPVFGTLEDFDRLVVAAHERGLHVLLDLIPCHTSIEHPWFREHPDWYSWSDGPRNNWRATFGGPAWSRDAATGRWYLHSHFPEQPDLDWRNPEVAAAMGDVISFWLRRGVDGFRLDAITRLGKDPEWRDDPPARTASFFPWNAEYAELEHRHSKNVHPWVGEALAALREAAADALLVGEAALPVTEWEPYLEHVDRLFAFELFHAPRPWTARSLRPIVDRALAKGGAAWVLSNHDASRLATRVGRENLRLALMLLLTLPGLAFLYAGDEIGLEDGRGARPALDRAGRDPARHPMQWDASSNGGFTSGTPWLPVVEAAERNVADQESDPDSVLALVRALIGLRRELGPALQWVEPDEGCHAYARGAHVVALNLGEDPVRLPAEGEVRLTTAAGGVTAGRLGPRAGAVIRRA
jgi:alpha-glucosidase